MVKHKFLIKIVIFALLCLFVNWLISDIFKYKGVEAVIPTMEFYNMEENTVDVLFIGSSSAFCGLSPMYIWRDYGITSVMRASFMVHPAVSELYLKEAFESQNPGLVIINPQMAFQEYDYLQYRESLNRALLFEKLSLQKLSAMFDIYKNSSYTAELHELMFPIFYYHYRWSILTRYDFDISEHLNDSRTRGQYMLPDKKEFQFQEYMIPSDEINNLIPISERYYRDMIEYCLDRGTEVALLIMPRQDWNYANHNGLQRLADEYGIEFIDLNIIEIRDVLDLDYSYDYLDSTHLNVFGSEKAAAYLGGFIQERYGIKDRRADAEISDKWNKDLDWFLSAVEKYKK